MFALGTLTVHSVFKLVELLYLLVLLNGKGSRALPVGAGYPEATVMVAMIPVPLTG